MEKQTQIGLTKLKWMIMNRISHQYQTNNIPVNSTPTFILDMLYSLIQAIPNHLNDFQLILK